MNPFLPRGLPRSLWIVAVTSAILMSGFGMVVPLIPVYGERLGASEYQIGLLMAGFFVGRLVMQVPSGIATDRIGRRPVMLYALFVYGVVCVGYALAVTPWVLISLRILQGAASGMFSISARSLISDLCDSDCRGQAQGVYSASVNLGFVAGPVLGAVMAERNGIASPFWLAAACCAVSFVLLWSYVPRSSRPTDSSEAHSTVPFMHRLRDPRVSILAVTNLFFMAGLSAVMTLFPLVGEGQIRGGLPFVGGALTTAGLAGLLFASPVGKISDHVGRVPILLLGAFLAAAEGTSLLLTRNPIVIVTAFFLGGIGVAAYHNCLHASVGDLSSESDRGTITGFVGFSGESGGVLGALMAPIIWVQTDLHIPFVMQPVATGLLLLFGVALWRMKPIHLRSTVVVRETILPG